MSYSNITGHRSMVFDKVRNAAYTRAMEKVITPETTVMDLGAGLGVLGLTAASLGAAKVYLVEPAIPANLPQEIAAANNLLQVECLETTAEALTLDTRVNLILSVFTGNFLLTEDLLPSLFYARDKYLAPGGKLIPDCGRMMVMPVNMPKYYREHVQVWQDSGERFAQAGLPPLDYQRIAGFAGNSLFYDTAKNFEPKSLAVPATLMELDFYTATSAACDTSLELTLTQGGICHGWLGWFQARMEGEWFSTGPDDEQSHWSQVFMPLQRPLEVNAGETLSFALKRPEMGEWTWTTGHNGNKQRQSTFLSEQLSPADLLKKSDRYQPALSAKGDAAQWLMQQMVGDSAMPELAVALQNKYPDLFPASRDASQFVKKVVKQWC